MLKSYLILAWRHLLKNKGYSIINITGLGLGMAIALVIGLYIADEYTFDSYHQNYHRIAEVMTLQSTPPGPWSTFGDNNTFVINRRAAQEKEEMALAAKAAAAKTTSAE